MNWVGRWAAVTQSRLTQTAATAVANATMNATANFKAALAEVTEDAARGVMCNQIFNLATVAISPGTANPPDDEDWRGDIEKEAETLLAGTFNPAGIEQVMNWYNWGVDVNNFANQASQAVRSNPTPYLNILSTPAGHRAAYAYVKFCYAPPAYDGPE